MIFPASAFLFFALPVVIVMEVNRGLSLIHEKSAIAMSTVSCLLPGAFLRTA